METYRIHDEASVYFVTFSVVDWLPVFVSEPACQIITQSFRHCYDKLGLRVYAYVIMPTHLHAICFDSEHDPARLSNALTSFRKFTGRSLLEFAQKRLPASFTQTFREAAESDRSRRFWQPSKHPVSITSEEFLHQKRDYLHDNPRRKGFVLFPEHWRFSSARFHMDGKDDYSDVVITDING